MREPNALELKACNLAAIRDTHRVGEGELFSALTASRLQMKAQLLAWHRSGKLSIRNISGLRRARFSKTRSSEARILGVIRSIGASGTEHVAEEIRKQQGVEGAS